MLFQVSPNNDAFTLALCKMKKKKLTQFHCWVGSGDGSTHAWSVRSGKQVGLEMRVHSDMIWCLIQDSCMCVGSELDGWSWE